MTSDEDTRRRRVSGRRRTLIAAVAVAVVGTAAVASASRSGTVGSAGRVAPEPTGATVEAEVTSVELPAGPACTGRFERTDLAHTTVSERMPSGLFDSNGSGVGAADLDDDGRVDIVLANLDAPNTIHWNEGLGSDGAVRFTTVEMDDRGTRAVQLVDVDADGRLDILTSHRGAGVMWWRNEGDRQFARRPLIGVSRAAYAMAWADVDADGDLDLATASYDAELDQVLRSSFLFSDGAGVVVYTNLGDGRFSPQRLTDSAQGLTVSWLDLDRDGTPELMVGNDFSIDDMIWQRSNDGWEPIEPFDVTAAHTMSTETGDIDGDGVEELFATDMKPMSVDTEVLAAWMPLIASMEGLDNPAARQKIRNVLLVPDADGRWVDRADQAGVDAAGWAWSGRFGDLDNDGDLDLHVANGMISVETFPYLEGFELVEENQAMSNDGRGNFTNREEWGLDDTASGRGSVIADVDGDGRLDVVVNNMDSPSTLSLNRLCTGAAVTVRLHAPTSANTAAIGARVEFDLGDRTEVRYVHSGGGYLSSAAPVLHVGVGDRDTIEGAVVRWPDGSTTDLGALTPSTAYEVTRP